MTGVIYARYSSDNQREESIEGQIRECLAFAERKNYTVVKKGLYHISADVVIDGTTAGDVVLTVLMDGVALPCTIKPATLVAGSSTEIHTETDICLESCCCDVNHTFTFVLTSSTGAGTVTNFCSGILKLA